MCNPMAALKNSFMEYRGLVAKLCYRLAELHQENAVLERALKLASTDFDALACLHYDGEDYVIDGPSDGLVNTWMVQARMELAKEASDG